MEQWKKGHKVLMTANTGAGKTYFVMNTLYQMCLTKNYRVLFLTNRVSLRDQLKTLYGKQSEDVVKIMNYQSFINYIKFMPHKIEGIYTLIIADECHYFFSDSTFANETDLPLNYLIENTENQLVIFLSATSQILQEYFQKQNEYKINFNYQFLKPYRFNQCFYWDDIEVIHKFLIELPKGEKAIFFCKSLKQAYQLHKELPDNSAFICSQGNPKYGDLCDVNILEQIRTKERFDKQILFTTNVIENGININDPQLKHIITDIYNFDTIVQCIGRKRIAECDELPNIYIKQIKQAYIQTYINNINNKMKPLECFYKRSNAEFNKQYSQKNKFGLLYTVSVEDNENLSKYVVNRAKEMKFNYDLLIANKINKIDTKFGHLKHLCKCMNIDISKFRDLSMLYAAVNIQDKLDHFLEKPLYGEDKKLFIELLQKNVLRPLQGGYKIDTVNRYFANIQLPYYITEKKQGNRNKDNYGRRAWILHKTESKTKIA